MVRKARTPLLVGAQTTGGYHFPANLDVQNAAATGAVADLIQDRPPVCPSTHDRGAS